MVLLLLIGWWAVMTIIARWICGRWFNHLTLYTAIWSVSLIALETHLIVYHAVVFEAWIYIFTAWIAIYLGTALIRLTRNVRPQQEFFPELSVRRLKFFIFIFSVAGLLSTIALFSNIVHMLDSGSAAALLENANRVYGMRLEGDVSGFMYLNFLPYAGCVLGGIYTARLGRLTLIALSPLAVMLADGAVSMQRAGMIYGTSLFVFSYLFAPKTHKAQLSRWVKVSVVAAAAALFTLVSLFRGAAELYEGESKTLENAGQSVALLPALYLYVSAPVVCFSEYLKHPEDDGKSLWGRYSFASIYRFASKLGFDTYVPYYQSYYDTPIPVNTGSYLREVYADFGGVGVFLFPFALGLVISLLETGPKGIVAAVCLPFLYILVLMSFTLDFVGGGGWYFPLPLALLTTYCSRGRARGKGALPLTGSVIHGSAAV
jgi:oligosaccharide repeat unit polymerase